MKPTSQRVAFRPERVFITANAPWSEVVRGWLIEFSPFIEHLGLAPYPVFDFTDWRGHDSGDEDPDARRLLR